MIARFVLFLAIVAPACLVAQPAVQVPFIGCQSDGQTGPVKAPVGKSRAVSVPSDAARQLAYYASDQIAGILAPRGWYCFGVYGSNGQSLYVSPQPINSAMVFSEKWAGLTGPAVQVSYSFGGTSGRFAVARTMARVFPARQAFVKSVQEQIEPASAFPTGPYPKDKLTYKGKNVVEYETPAQTQGLGTDSRLVKNADPIRGLVMLTGDDPDLLSLAVRVPADRLSLAAAIVQQFEQDRNAPAPR